jgi:hypothetical protein
MAQEVMNDDRKGEIAPQAVYTTDPPGRIGNPHEAQAIDDPDKQQRAQDCEDNERGNSMTITHLE